MIPSTVVLTELDGMHKTSEVLDVNIPPAAPDSAWHAVAPDAVLDALRTNVEGLSEREATRRLDTYGPNRLPQGPAQSALIRFLLQFHNLLIYVLLAAAALAAAMGHGTDALVILAVTLMNAIIGFVQEGRAEKALDAIRAMIDPHASVIRDGLRVTVGADAVVPGDILMLEAGDRVPADLLRQDRHAHPQRDDREHGGHRRPRDRGRGRWLCALGRLPDQGRRYPRSRQRSDLGIAVACRPAVQRCSPAATR